MRSAARPAASTSRPRHRRVNYAYELGGPRLTVRPLQEAVRRTRASRSRSTTSSMWTSAASAERHHQRHRRRLRRHRPRYFNDTGRASPHRRAPGLPAPKRPARAGLRRYRHDDTDLVRGVREQEVLRAPSRGRAWCRLSTTADAYREVVRASYTDAAIKDCGARRSLLKLVLFTAGNPSVRSSFGTGPRQQANPFDPPSTAPCQDRVRQFPRGSQASKEPRQDCATDASPKPPPGARPTTTAARSAGPGKVARRAGDDQRPSPAAGCPFYYPDALALTARLRGHRPPRYGRSARRASKLPQAYRHRRSSGDNSASTTASRAPPGRSRRCWTTRYDPRQGKAAPSSCTTTGTAEPRRVAHETVLLGLEHPDSSRLRHANRCSSHRRPAAPARR